MGWLSGTKTLLLFLAICCVVALVFFNSSSLYLKQTSIKKTAKRNARNQQDDYYVVFSTDCSDYQHWQSLVFFYRAYKANQPGQIVRIASGCSNQQAQDLKERFETMITPLSQRFRLHFTPDYSRRSTYKYYNKPFGLKHFMEHSLGYPNPASGVDNAVVILLDPDQMLQRPLTRDFSSTDMIWHTVLEPNRTLRVQHGFPMAQLYAFKSQPFTAVNLTDVVGHKTTTSSSGAINTTLQEASSFYAAGPPYLATSRDMYQIVLAWTEFVPKVHSQYPHLLAEMFAYSIAAAHLHLPHQLAKSFMVSNAAAGGLEGWPLVDSLSMNQVCLPPRSTESVPFVLHYCQEYRLGKWYFFKRRLHLDFFTCTSPLLLEPPENVGLRFDENYLERDTQLYMNPVQNKRNAWVLCNLIPSINEAAAYYKTRHCGNKSVNLNKTLIIRRH